MYTQSTQNSMKNIFLFLYWYVSKFYPSRTTFSFKTYPTTSLKCYSDQIFINLFRPVNFGQGMTSHKRKEMMEQYMQSLILAKNSKEMTIILPIVRQSSRNYLSEADLRQQTKIKTRPLQMIEFSQVKPKESKVRRSLLPTDVNRRITGYEKISKELTMTYQLVKKEMLGVFENFINYQQCQKIIEQYKGQILSILPCLPHNKELNVKIEGRPFLERQLHFIKQFKENFKKMYEDNSTKLAQALLSFMNRSVIPALPQNHDSLNQWKFLNGILSSKPLDYGQLDFYLHMVNKNSPNQPHPQQNINNSYSSYGQDNNSPSKFNRFTSENINKKSGFGIANNRKKLVANMQNIQNLMIKNQQQLQGYTKKDNNTSLLNTSSNASFNIGSRKYI